MAGERICLLECFQCQKEFEKDLETGEAITSAAREARCPYCGHKPVRTRPTDVWSAVDVHKIKGMK